MTGEEIRRAAQKEVWIALHSFFNSDDFGFLANYADGEAVRTEMIRIAERHRRQVEARRLDYPDLRKESAS